MKRVVDKLKMENDRLKRGQGAGGSTGAFQSGEERTLAGGNSSVGGGAKAADTTAAAASVAEKRYAAEKKRSDRLEEENKALVSKLKGFEDISQRTVQKQQQIAVLRKAVKTKEDEVAAAREQAGALLGERDAARAKTEQLESRVVQLELSLQQQQQLGGGGGGRSSSSSAGPSSSGISGVGGVERQQLLRELDQEKARSTELVRTNEVLRSDLADAKRIASQAISAAERAAAGTNVVGGGNSGAVPANVRAIHEENSKLRSENEKLRLELQAFDLDFFEEIENLKFAHAEAVRKLRMYEGSSGHGQAGGGSRR
jgi:hypothetical protein